MANDKIVKKRKRNPYNGSTRIVVFTISCKKPSFAQILTTYELTQRVPQTVILYAGGVFACLFIFQQYFYREET